MTHRTRFLALLPPIAGIAGACAVTEVRETAACRQTYEFGNYGCAVAAGRVLDSLGQPVVGALVGPTPSEDGIQFNTPYATTSADGSYSVKLTRFGRGESDLVWVWLRASRIPTHVDSVGVRDSVRVQLRVSPVGAIPDTAVVDLVLPPA